jgi:hypothetical protein
MTFHTHKASIFDSTENHAMSFGMFLIMHFFTFVFQRSQLFVHGEFFLFLRRHRSTFVSFRFRDRDQKKKKKK